MLYELISKNKKLAQASLLISMGALIYVSNIILPIDNILLVRKASLVEIQNIRGETAYVEHDKDFLYLSFYILTVLKFFFFSYSDQI